MNIFCFLLGHNRKQCDLIDVYSDAYAVLLGGEILCEIKKGKRKCHCNVSYCERCRTLFVDIGTYEIRY